jgi:hypothetical protein
MPPKAEFWDPSVLLPSGMRDATTIFKQKLAKRSRFSSAPALPGFVGMEEWDPESIYDLLPSTLGDTDSESGSKGSCHPVRECNMLHLSRNGAAAAPGEEDDGYPIPRTPREQPAYEQERLE